MFDIIRKYQKYLMGFLLILIVPSFVFLGTGNSDLLSTNRAAVVASVGSHDITQDQWDQAHRAESERMLQSMPGLSPQALDTKQARWASLERLVRAQVLDLAWRDLGLNVSDQRLARYLQENETIASLRGPDGKLDMAAYRQLLAAQDMTPEIFEARVRANLSEQQVLLGIENGSFSPESLSKIAFNALLEQREIKLAQFKPADFVSQVTVNEADIQDFYQRNLKKFQLPERADVEYLVLDTAALQKNITLTPAELRTYYDQNRSQFSDGGQRRASHILLTVASGVSAPDKQKIRQKADQLHAQVMAAPQKFAELAKTHSQDPGSASQGGDLGFFGRGMMVKPFEQAAFDTAKGAISPVVESEFGFHIIQVTDVKEENQRSFEQVQSEIEATLKKQRADKQLAELAEPFSNMVYEQADSLPAVAAHFKLPMQTFQGLTRAPAPAAGVLANESLRNAIFSPESIRTKRSTPAIEITPSQLVAARIVAYTPARTQPLAEVRESVRAQWVAERSVKLAQAAGAKQLQAWKAGSAATALSGPMVVSRDAPGELPDAVLSAVLSTSAKQLPVWVGVDVGQQGYAVVKIGKVLPPQARDAKAVAQEARQYTDVWQLAESLAYYEALKEKYKVKMKAQAPQSGSMP